MNRQHAVLRTFSRVTSGWAAACALLALSGCADQLLGIASRAQDRQCSQLVVPEQREACLRDVNGTRPVAAPRELERPRPAPVDAPTGAPTGAPTVRKDDAAARAARRSASEAPAAAASAP